MVTITKSVTILAVPGAVGSFVTTGSSALLINTPGVTITLRNLSVTRLAGTGDGISFFAGSALTVEDCELSGVTTGIYVQTTTPMTNVTIRNTVIQDATSTGVFLWGGVRATVDGVHLLRGVYGLVVSTGASATVGNSVIASNSTAGVVAGFGGSNDLVVANSLIDGNGFGAWALCNAASCDARVTLQHDTVVDNSVGVVAYSIVGSTAFVMLDDNAVTRNTTGIQYTSPASIFTRGNNTVENNATDLNGPPMTARSGR
jgi:hypothetical protein